MASAVTEKAGYTNIPHAPTSSKLPQAQAPKGTCYNPQAPRLTPPYGRPTHKTLAMHPEFEILPSTTHFSICFHQQVTIH